MAAFKERAREKPSPMYYGGAKAHLSTTLHWFDESCTKSPQRSSGTVYNLCQINPPPPPRRTQTGEEMIPRSVCKFEEIEFRNIDAARRDTSSNDCLQMELEQIQKKLGGHSYP